MDKGEPDPGTRVRTIQKPVYYVSEVLHKAKARYLETHKLIYAILIASRKLRHYFQAHRVVVVTSYPLRAILHNSNATFNLAKQSRAKSWLTSSRRGPPGSTTLTGFRCRKVHLPGAILPHSQGSPESYTLMAPAGTTLPVHAWY